MLRRSLMQVRKRVTCVGFFCVSTTQILLTPGARLATQVRQVAANVRAISSASFNTPLSVLDPPGSPTVGDIYQRIENNLTALKVNYQLPTTNYTPTHTSNPPTVSS